MTTTKETCPKCGSVRIDLYGYPIIYECDSSNTTVKFDQSDRCRISELEKENEILQRKLDHETSLVAALQKESLILEKENEKGKELAHFVLTITGMDHQYSLDEQLKTAKRLASALLQKKGEG